MDPSPQRMRDIGLQVERRQRLESRYVFVNLIFAFLLIYCDRFEGPYLDKTAGRVQIFGGDLYYSPNCSRDVQVPPRHTTSNPFSPNPKENLWRLDVSEYERPRWWSDCYGWIAFYNKHIFDTPSTLLSPLRYSHRSTAQFQEDVGYSLPSWAADEWLLLDNQLANATYELRGLLTQNLPGPYDDYALPPRNPWAFGYLRPHSKLGTLLLCLEKSKNWFGVWLTLLSYTIAHVESSEIRRIKDPLLARESWKNLLVTKGVKAHIDLAWIDLLLDTTVATFSSHVWRAGVFLYIPGDRSKCISQPNVEWFVEYSVPVWYRWDPKLVSPKNQYLAPLAHQLQSADGFIRKSPSLLPSSMDTSMDNNQPEQVPAPTARMDAFFKIRDERTARLKDNETPQQRALRISRENQHPTVNARVFEWTPNELGEFVSEEILSKWCHKEVLEDYRGNQRRYNAILNEWHLCVLLDSFGDSNDEEDVDYVPPHFYEDDTSPNSPAISYGDNNRFDDDIWIPQQQEPELSSCSMKSSTLQPCILVILLVCLYLTERF